MFENGAGLEMLRPCSTAHLIYEQYICPRASWVNIATDFGLEPVAEVGMNHLASLTQPWLLIVDNLDDLGIDVRDFVPLNIWGGVIAATRASSMEQIRAIADRHYALHELSTEESIDLLSSAGYGATPEQNRRAALDIAEVLGYYPLALIQAGRAIDMRFTTLESYLECYREVQSILPSGSLRSKTSDSGHRNNSMINTIWEDSIQNVSEDARRLLEMLCYLHYDNIPIQTLLNRSQERPINWDTEDATIFFDRALSPTKWTFARAYKSLIQFLGGQSRRTNTLPRVASIDSGGLDRAHAAFKMFVQCSILPTCFGKGNLFKIHRVMRDYVVGRLGSYARQFMACEAAIELLENCIELDLSAPGQAFEYVEARSLLPHLIHAREQKDNLILAYQLRQQSIMGIRSWLFRYCWPTLSSIESDPYRLLKFSAVYCSVGEYQDARRLQEQARDLLMRKYGTSFHPQCINASFMLALTHHHLHLFDRAIDLQEGIVQICKELHGDTHRITLSMIDVLALYYLSRGDLAKSFQHSQQAVSGLEEENKQEADWSENKSMLVALNHLGAIQAQYYRWKDSKKTLYDGAEGS